jgi:maltose O-acetyltransferase
MTEKEKMLAGLAYLPRDPELMEMHHRARKFMREFNSLDSKSFSKKQKIMKEYLGTVGENVWIEAPFYCDYGENIHIGEGSFVNMNCVFLDVNPILIGKNTLIAPSVQIYTAYHPKFSKDRILWNESGRSEYITLGKRVEIGSQTWIGGGVIILPGVKIGDQVTVGAGSVVTKDIPSGSIAIGNPCVVVGGDPSLEKSL